MSRQDVVFQEKQNTIVHAAILCLFTSVVSANFCWFWPIQRMASLVLVDRVTSQRFDAHPSYHNCDIKFVSCLHIAFQQILIQNCIRLMERLMLESQQQMKLSTKADANTIWWRSGCAVFSWTLQWIQGIEDAGQENLACMETCETLFLLLPVRSTWLLFRRRSRLHWHQVRKEDKTAWLHLLLWSAYTFMFTRAFLPPWSKPSVQTTGLQYSWSNWLLPQHRLQRCKQILVLLWQPLM